MLDFIQRDMISCDVIRSYVVSYDLVVFLSVVATFPGMILQLPEINQ